MKRLTFIVGLVALCALAFVPDIVEGTLVEPSKCFGISLEDKYRTTNDNWPSDSGTDNYVGRLMFCRRPPCFTQPNTFMWSRASSLRCLMAP